MRPASSAVAQKMQWALHSHSLQKLLDSPIAQSFAVLAVHRKNHSADGKESAEQILSLAQWQALPVVDIHKLVRGILLGIVREGHSICQFAFVRNSLLALVIVTQLD